MQRITQPKSSGSAAYGNTLMIAAALSMRSSRRHLVWFTPTGGASRGIPESDPRHKAAVRRALEGGPLNGARETWSDEAGTWIVREA